jgi:hypothetical protein
MKHWHKESQGSSNNKSKQSVIPVASIIAFVFVLITVPSMIYAQNTTSTPSNATTAESHTTNTTGTPLNATTSTAPKSVGG